MCKCRYLGATLLLVAGCSPSNTPTSNRLSLPSPAPSTPPVSGVVVEGTLPVEGAVVNTGKYPSVTTDAGGRFQLPFADHDFVQASKDGYAQPCAAPISPGIPMTVQVVSETALSSAGLVSPPGFRTISGVVMVTTASGTQPTAGIWVWFEPNGRADGWPAARTITGVDGRFSLCTLPESAVTLVVSLKNTTTSVTVAAGQTEVELTVRFDGVDGTRR